MSMEDFRNVIEMFCGRLAGCASQYTPLRESTTDIYHHIHIHEPISVWQTKVSSSNRLTSLTVQIHPQSMLLNEFLVAKENDRPFDPLYDLSDEEEAQEWFQQVRKTARLRRELKEAEEQAAQHARKFKARDTRNQPKSTTPAIGLDARPFDGKPSTTKEASISGKIRMCSE